MNNAPKTRRWRVAYWYGNTASHAAYEFPCTVSDRVAIVHTPDSNRLCTWGVWGYPAPQGVCIIGGNENSFKAAQKAARKALDKIAEDMSRGIYPDIPEIREE